MTTEPGPAFSRSAFLAAAAGLVVTACGGSESAPAGSAPDDTANRETGSGPATVAPATSEASADLEPSPAIDDNRSSVGSVTPVALVGATTIEGATFDAATLAGRPTVAWFWASWCVICRGEAPDVVDVVSRYSDRVNFVGVAGRGEPSDMREFVLDTETGLFPHLNDSTGDIWASYEIYAQPAFAFITVDGRLETFVGSLGADDLEAIIDQLLVA